MARVQSHAEVILAAHAQAEMAQKEQQIQALRVKAKSRSALVPLLMNRVATCKKEVGEEVRSSPSCGLRRQRTCCGARPSGHAVHAVRGCVGPDTRLFNMKYLEQALWSKFSVQAQRGLHQGRRP